MVRVVLNRRRSLNLKAKQKTVAKKKEVETAPSPEPVSTTSDSSSEEEEDDFFIPDEDSLLAQNSYIPQYASSSDIPTSIRGSISLERLDEEGLNSDEERAVAILETFFFGGTSSTETVSAKGSRPETSSNEKPSLVATTATHSNNLPASPTSTLIPPFPGSSSEKRQQRFRHSLSTMNLPSEEKSYPLSAVERAYSMPSIPPLPGSPARPKKPVLKRTGSSTCSLNSSKRNVSFTDVQFREYKVALSQHPSCSFGPPVELGWDYTEAESVPVEDYEGSRSPRREVHDLLLSYNARRRMLLKQAGYSKQELRDAEKEVDRVKRGRMMTEIFLPAQVIDEGLEKFVGFLKKTFSPQSAPACE